MRHLAGLAARPSAGAVAARNLPQAGHQVTAPELGVGGGGEDTREQGFIGFVVVWERDSFTVTCSVELLMCSTDKLEVGADPQGLLAFETAGVAVLPLPLLRDKAVLSPLWVDQASDNLIVGSWVAFASCTHAQGESGPAP